MLALLGVGLLASLAWAKGSCSSGRPNIVLLLTDDQDRRLGSTDYQSVLHREMIAKGTEFVNHYATVAQCCPSRASLFRGQAGHNTNITHVNAPGGNYDKWVLAGEDMDYLPFWLSKAGYRVEYLGKILNGYDTTNYNTTPKGWDHVDCLVDPYTYAYNTVVMSENGQRPVLYRDYHQTDVIRAKALARLEHLTRQDKPFYFQIAPTSPHVSQRGDSVIFNPVPLARHANDFSEAQAPRPPNFNPPDDIQAQRASWIKTIPLMNDSQLAYADEQFRSRIRSLQGIDEILEDVIELLDKKGCLDNTYIIFTTDNGYHIGNHRAVGGKALPFAEDTNLPFVVRGPNVPAGKTSKLPGAHLDLAPTFLQIAGVANHKLPVFLDGRSLLDQWHEPEQVWDRAGTGNAKEILNVEFWGGCHFEAPPFTSWPNNSYKTLRIVGEDESWLFSKWCTGDMELYDTSNDPYELHNLINSTEPHITRLIDRLNALLLVTKSCSDSTCRNPWSVLQPSHTGPNPSNHHAISNLHDAMHPRYDAFFASFPRINFKECMLYQDVENEAPFYPPGSRRLQTQFRRSTDNFVSVTDSNFAAPSNEEDAGGWEQRHATLEDVLRRARPLTDEELGI